MTQQPDLPFPFWFPFAVLGLWTVGSFLAAEKSDWRLLARKYRAAARPEGQSFRRQVYRVGAVPESGVTQLVIAARGLYLAPLLPFRLGRPPMLVPWSAIVGVVSGRSWGRRWYSLNIDGLTLIRVGAEAFEAMRVHVPTPRDAAA
jgi:hypothetical protein